MEQKIIQEFSAGKGECEHEFIYDKPVRFSFSYPPVVQQFRICECCGKSELTLGSEVFEFDADKAKELIIKFSK